MNVAEREEYTRLVEMAHPGIYQRRQHERQLNEAVLRLVEYYEEAAHIHERN